jgi:hypothetical protein
MQDFSQVYALARAQQRLEAEHIDFQEKGGYFAQMQWRPQNSTVFLKEESISREDSERQLRKQIQVLQNEKILFAGQQEQRFRELERKVKQLEALNQEYSKQIEYLQSQDTQRQSQTTCSTVIQRAEPEEQIAPAGDSFLALSRREILQKGSEIHELKERLGDALQLNNMLKPSVDLRYRTGLVSIQEKASSLNYNINKTARSIALCLKLSVDFIETEILETLHSGLHHLIRDRICSVSILFKHTVPAVCALISSLLRDQIFYSDIWTSLGRGELMVEEYRRLIRQGGKLVFTCRPTGNYSGILPNLL